jgi:PBSX family phage terminase large subunit
MKIQFHDKQKEALKQLSIDNDCRQLLYGGAASSGKSFLGCDWQIKRRLKYPGTRGLIGRSELKKLRLSTMATFFELCAMYGLNPDKHWTYNGQDHVIKFYNGSQIILMDLADLPSDPEFQRFGSIELTDAFVDEAGEVSQKCIDILSSRLRYKLINDKPKLLMTCNPHKGWLYNEFFDAQRNGTIRKDRRFIQALPTDNPHVSKVYLESLQMLPIIDRKRLLEGDWDYDETKDRLYEYDDLLRCFRNPSTISQDKFITADIARMGDDRTVIVLWNGLHAEKFIALKHKPINEVVDTIRQLSESNGVRLSNVLCDEDGIGGGVVDFMKCKGFLNGSKAVRDNYMNLKADCYFKLGELITTNAITFESTYKDTIIKELEMIRREKIDSDGKLRVTNKEDLKKRFGMSPDFADAIMMRCFYELKKNFGKYAFG